MEYSTNVNAQAIYVSNTSFDSYTKTASHFDGADAATAYTDPIAGAYTFVGTAQLDTAQFKFGTAALLLDGNSDYVTLPDSANWYFGTNDFTIDFWVKFNSHLAVDALCGQYVDVNNQWFINYINGSNLLGLYSITGGVVKQVFNTSCSTMATAQWYHVALVRNGTTSTASRPSSVSSHCSRAPWSRRVRSRCTTGTRSA